MKTTRAAFVCLALVSGAVFADGVSLITPSATAIQASPALEAIAGSPSFVRFHQINLNRAAFGSGSVTVKIDGKEYTFVGSMKPPREPLTEKEKAKGMKPWNWRTWSGTTTSPEREYLVLSRDMDNANGPIHGELFLQPNRVFNLTTPRGGVPVLVERDANVRTPINRYPDTPAAAASGVGK